MDYVIHTDYGPVKLSQKTKDFMFAINPDWEDLLNNKRRRGKNALYIRSKFKQIETTVLLLTEMAFSVGDEFEEF